MVRNQVYLTTEQDRELRLKVALGEGTYSELIRKGIDELLKKNGTKNNNWKAWKNFIGAVKGGERTDAVKDIQDYYETGIVK